MTTTECALSTAYSDVTFHSNTSMLGIKTIDVAAMKQTLRILLSSSTEYIKGIKPKKEWIANCPYSELKAAIQTLSGRTNRIRGAKKGDIVNVDSEQLLVSMLGVNADGELLDGVSPSSPSVAMEEAKTAKLVKIDVAENKWLESQLQT